MIHSNCEELLPIIQLIEKTTIFGQRHCHLVRGVDELGAVKSSISFLSTFLHYVVGCRYGMVHMVTVLLYVFLMCGF